MQPFAPLRFYDNLTEQNCNRPWTDQYLEVDTHMIMSWRNFVPFLIKKTLSNANTVSGCLLHNTESGFWTDIFSLISGGFGAAHDTDTGERWLYYTALATVTWPAEFSATDDGVIFQMAQKAVYFRAPLYLEITDGISIWYSETFYLKDFNESDLTLCDYLKLEWTATCRVGDLPYNLGAPGLRAFFKADIGRPQYVYEDEVEEDGLKNKNLIFQRAEKRSRLELLVPEYMADALSLVPLHNIVILTDRLGAVHLITESEFSAEWESEGAMADVTLDLLLQKSIKSCC